ncbi:LysM domain-containing protein [Schleiferia thermophila]|uniref:LysM domain-containing protein n=3 Tax=Schleiferia thermophila TaxID=884107 RepID=A0A369A6C4_9FLAO|nr:LysM domain-containing protein [Schleiferia thermophila]
MPLNTKGPGIAKDPGSKRIGLSQILFLPILMSAMFTGSGQDFSRWIEARYAVVYSDVLPTNYAELTAISRELTGLLTRYYKNEYAAGFYRKHSPRQVQAIAFFKAQHRQINDTALALASLLTGFYTHYLDKYDLAGPCKLSILEAIDCQLMLDALVDERRDLIKSLLCLSFKISNPQYLDQKLQQIVFQEEETREVHYDAYTAFQLALRYFSGIEPGAVAKSEVDTVVFPYAFSLEQWIESREELRKTEFLNTSLKTDIVPARFPLLVHLAVHLTKSPTPVEKKMPQPSSTTHSTRYIVRRGDTLTAIARKFGTTVEALKYANQLKSDRITEGQSLVIPQR